MQVQDKIVLITGASGGIGSQISKHLSENGATVILAARASDKLTSLEKEIKNSFAVATDLVNESDIEKLVKAAVDKYGKIDILINCAGIGMFSKVESIDVKKYRDVLELNLIAPLLMMEKVIPVMKKQGGGTIVNISSLSSKKYIPNIAGYASTKHALNAISLTAREELAGDKITVSIVCPYIVNTDFGKHSVVPEPDALRFKPDGTLLPTVLSPQKVAEEVLKIIGSGEAEVLILPPSA